MKYSSSVTSAMIWLAKIPSLVLKERLGLVAIPAVNVSV